IVQHVVRDITHQNQMSVILRNYLIALIALNLQVYLFKFDVLLTTLTQYLESRLRISHATMDIRYHAGGYGTQTVLPEQEVLMVAH
ncbi:MAG: hypothetical protein QF885_07980, partial [Candidatus Thalassarchaeaceae archaeon]|nr:hypothetical protein [Candidatus Thalassarchaeaceae archaeon]